jgi:hypothetical protein
MTLGSEGEKKVKIVSIGNTLHQLYLASSMHMCGGRLENKKGGKK